MLQGRGACPFHLPGWAQPETADLHGTSTLRQSAAKARGAIEFAAVTKRFPGSVVLAFVHLYRIFAVVPVFISMMRIDRRLLEAARDAGASAWQTIWHVVVPLAKPGLVIGSIFVIVLVMGDFATISVMGGQQIASVGKVIQVQMSYLQFPAAEAQAMVLLALVLLVIAVMTKLVDIRREL